MLSFVLQGMSVCAGGGGSGKGPCHRRNPVIRIKRRTKKNKKEEYIFSSIVINVKNNKQKQRTIINNNRKTLKVGSVGMVVEKWAEKEHLQYPRWCHPPRYLRYAFCTPPTQRYFCRVEWLQILLYSGSNTSALVEYAWRKKGGGRVLGLLNALV